MNEQEMSYRRELNEILGEHLKKSTILLTDIHETLLEARLSADEPVKTILTEITDSISIHSATVNQELKIFARIKKVKGTDS